MNQEMFLYKGRMESISEAFMGGKIQEVSSCLLEYLRSQYCLYPFLLTGHRNVINILFNCSVF